VISEYVVPEEIRKNVDWSYFDSYVNVSERSSGEKESAEKKLVERSREWWNRFAVHKCIFVHIPKNAGTSVEELLIGCESAPRSQHFTCRELKSQNPELYSSLFRFCIVRNPYDRLISAYEYLLHGGNRSEGGLDMAWQKKLLSLGSFRSFVESYFVDPQWSSLSLPSHFIPQCMFICDETGTIDVDCCLPFEQFIQSGLSGLGNQGLTSGIVHKPPPPSILESPTIPHQRKGGSQSRVGYDTSGVIAEIVYAAYRTDFELLGFNKDTWRKWVRE